MNRIRILPVVAAAVLVFGLGTLALAAPSTFSTASFTPAERQQLRAVNDWYRRCVTQDITTCGPASPPTTTPPVTTTAPAPPTTTVAPTTTTTAPASGAMPTRANTGPSGITGTMTAAQFLTSGVCDHKRITDQVRDEAGRMLGRTLTIDNCAFDGGLYYAEYGNSNNLPTVTIRSSSINGWLMFSPMRVTADRAFVQGAYWTPCPDCGAQDHQPGQTVRPMPITVTNSYFFAAAPPASSPYHSEALHVVGGGDGYRFTNTRFTQEGPYNGTQTGAIKFSGRNSVFDRDYFDWGGTSPAAYFAMYFEGANVTVSNCRASKGLTSYLFPDVWSPGNGYTVPVLQNCRDFDTGAAI